MCEKERFLESVLRVDLLEELAGNGLVRNIRIGLRGDVEWSVLVDRDVRAQVADELGRKLALFCYSGREFTGIILDVLRGKT